MLMSRLIWAFAVVLHHNSHLIKFPISCVFVCLMGNDILLGESTLSKCILSSEKGSTLKENNLLVLDYMLNRVFKV